MKRHYQPSAGAGGCLLHIFKGVKRLEIERWCFFLDLFCSCPLSSECNWLTLCSSVIGLNKHHVARLAIAPSCDGVCSPGAWLLSPPVTFGYDRTCFEYSLGYCGDNKDEA